MYLYGVDFALWTDRKPLDFIYSAHFRRNRWVLPVKYFIEYLSGHMDVVDALSHLTKNVAAEYIRFVAKTAAPQA